MKQRCEISADSPAEWDIPRNCDFRAHWRTAADSVVVKTKWAPRASRPKLAATSSFIALRVGLKWFSDSHRWCAVIAARSVDPSEYRWRRALTKR